MIQSTPSFAVIHTEPIRDAAADPEPGAARAVEVAAMLGDSVIGVKHCMDPRSGKPSAMTWGLCAAGAACLIASAIAFVLSLRATGDDRAAREAWARQGRPAHAFRPHELAPAVDWIALGSVVLGVVGLSLGLVRLRRERTSPYYRIGTAPGVELAIAEAPAAAFPLIAPSGDDFVFNYARGIEGEMIIDGKPVPLAELGAGWSRPSATVAGAIEVPIPERARIRARAGRATFVISAVERPRRHAAPLWARLEHRALAYVAGSLVVHLAVWALLQLIPPDASGISVAPTGVEDGSMRAAGIARIEPPPDRSHDPGNDGDGGMPGDSTAMTLPSGTTGNPAATHDGHLQVAQLDDRPRLARPDAIAQALRDSMLGSEQLRAAVGALGATGDLSVGFDPTSVNGSIYGASGEGWGSFGAGVSGFELGSCGGEPPCGAVYSGSYATIGKGRRAGDHLGFPRGRGVGLPGHIPTVPRVGEPTTSGTGYDKKIVRRYIRRYIDQIAYCYDKQLLARPGIEGEVSIAFVISPTGVVQSAAGTGFDAQVSSCLASVVQQIAFPPPGGGGVQVHYPFHFHAAR